MSPTNIHSASSQPGCAGRAAAVIGGVNLDVVGFPAAAPLNGESNPGTVRTFAGGVGRNIAENLSRLEVPTRLLSVVGDDPQGASIVEDCRRSGIDMSHTAVVDGATSCYLAILDAQGDLRLAVSQMDLLDRLDKEFIDRRAAVIGESSLVILDANLRRSVIEHLLSRFVSGSTDVPFFIDTVSAAKARRLHGLIGHAHTIKPNRTEAEVLCGMKITGRGDLEKALGYFLGLGVRRVFVSLGEEGMFFGDENGSGCLPAPPTEVVNATGAGDAAMAALAYAYLEGMPLEDSARLALAASALTLSSEAATHPEMGVSVIENLLGELA